MVNTDPLTVWNILLVDDDEDDFVLIRQMLSDLPRRQINVEWASRFDGAMQKFQQGQYDAVLIDYDLGAHTGLELIHRWAIEGMETPMIVVTGRGSYENDLESMRAGAVDYISKAEMTGPLLERAIRYAIERKQIEQGLEKRVEERTDALQKTTEDLRSSIEELVVMEEEVRQQNDELAKAHDIAGYDQIYYKQLFQNAPIGYLITDLNGKITTANQYSSALLRTPLAILEGKLLQSYIDPKDRSEFRYKFIQQLKEKQIQNLRYTFRLQGGVQFDCLLFSAPFVNSGGEVEQLQWVLVEANGQVQAKQAIQDEKEVLRKHIQSQAEATEYMEGTQAMPDAILEAKIDAVIQQLQERLKVHQDLESLLLLRKLKEQVRRLRDQGEENPQSSSTRYPPEQRSSARQD